MKRFYLIGMAALMTVPAFSQTFRKGDMVVDLDLGVGAAQIINSEYNYNGDLVSDKQTKPTFTQKLGFEVGVLDLSDVSSLGFGVNINNACGARHSQYIGGAYDYSYTLTTYEKNMGGEWRAVERTKIHRNGDANALAKATLNDFNVMFKVAYHHQFVDKLDTYGAFGFGVAARKTTFGSLSNITGVYSGSGEYEPGIDGNQDKLYSYSFNDEKHVKWNGSSLQGAIALGLYVGARYYLTENWAVNCEFGLNSVSFKKNLNDFNILSLGASYKF